MLPEKGNKWISSDTRSPQKVITELLKYIPYEVGSQNNIILKLGDLKTAKKNEYEL
ncbi:MAG: hypothetical protein MJE68_32770 [Proteobacteria bacterium]|nr:hypothetical protein [Pseudomonadota bacterium]